MKQFFSLLFLLFLISCQPLPEEELPEELPEGDDVLIETDLIVSDQYNNSRKISSRPRITEDYGLKTKRNFKFNCPEINLNYRCMKERKRDLIIIDPGHDDSATSARSADHTLSSSHPNYRKPRKHINEGRLNLIVGWLTKEILVQCNPGLNQEQKNALMAAIHLTRYPGEKKFGTYQNLGPRQTSLGGTITSGITNRKDWVNKLLSRHREYDPSHADGLSSNISNYSSRAIFMSLHADNLTYTSGSRVYPYNAIDRSKIFVPKNVSLSSSSDTILFSESMKSRISENGLEYLEIDRDDTRSTAELKEGSERSLSEREIDIDHHHKNLAMLSSSLGNSKTVKVLVEGFTMTGKVGNLISNELDSSEAKFLSFSRESKQLGTWKVSDYYIQYAKALAQTVSDHMDCR